MELDEIKRSVIKMRGGVGSSPTTRWVDTRDGQPEIVNIGETLYRDTTVYIPKLPLVPSLTSDADDIVLTPETITLGTREARTIIQIVERTEVDVSDPLHPVITIYGYKRIYRVRVWVTDDEASAIDRLQQ